MSKLFVFDSARQSYIPVLSLKSRFVYVILGLFFGMFGIHNFYIGYNDRGIAQLILTFFGLFVGFIALIAALWVLVDICTRKEDSRGNSLI